MADGLFVATPLPTYQSATAQAGLDDVACERAALVPT